MAPGVAGEADEIADRRRARTDPAPCGVSRCGSTLTNSTCRPGTGAGFSHLRELQQRRRAHIRAVREAEEHQGRLALQVARREGLAAAVDAAESRPRRAACGSQVPLASCGAALSSCAPARSPPAPRTARRRPGCQDVRVSHERIIPQARTRRGAPPRPDAARHRARADRAWRAAPARARGCSSATAPTTPRDEAAALVLHALRLPHAGGARPCYAPPRQRRRAAARVRGTDHAPHRGTHSRRLPDRRRPGSPDCRFSVDPRVLIPRSPIAELIERRFAPWIDPARVRRVLDLGTGSGCIAIACAQGVSARARRCGRISRRRRWKWRAINVRQHRLQRRVRLLQSDHFSALRRRSLRYHLSAIRLMSGRASCGRCRRSTGTSRAWRSPRGATGLDSVRVILREAGRHLRPGGILVVEVGNTETAVRRAFPRLPFIWLTSNAAAAECSC